MINIKLKGDIIREYDEGTTILEVAKSIGAGLYKAACCAKVDGKLVDLRHKLTNDCSVEILTFDDEEGKKAYFHTTSHIMAQAVKRLFPGVLFAIGPAIDRGFYYDIDLDRTITADDLKDIENEMKKITKEDLEIERFTLSAHEAMELMKDQPYKLELIKEHSERGEELLFYKQGEFVDLCTGPHLVSTGRVRAIKLTSCTGAYFKGDSKNKMLKRIYGISFPKESMLNEYLEMQEEAKKRDHNKIGRELGFFTTTDYIGQGLPILLPKGARVIQTLQRFVEDEEEKRGYLLTKTPFLAKSDLYKISGHWYHYKDSMFILGDEEKDDEVFALRPMTCPFQFQAYLAKQRSYRDLPMRLNETSTLFRNESSGEMHGLIRVRQFTISEGHIACAPSQLEQEVRECIELANFMLKTVGLDKDVYYRFSKWDENNKEKYIGSAEEWENVQNKMREILNNLNIDYTEADGEAAFYGPKLDIQIKNVYGKEDTIVTVQIDFQLAERFSMTYIDENGEKKYPYVVHRTSLGCYERTLALLLEKYAGALPVWLMPEQVRVLPISEKFYDSCKEILSSIKAAGIKASIDMRDEKIGYKIREAQLEKIPYMLIIGDKEICSNTVSIRSRKNGDMGSMNLCDFIEMINSIIKNKQVD